MSYPSTKMQSGNSTAPADWGTIDGTLTGTTTLSQSGVMTFKGVFQIP